MGSLRRGAIARTVGRMAASLLPFVGFILACNRLTRSLWTPGSSLGNLLLLLAEALGAAGILLGMYRLLGVEVIKELMTKRKTR